MTTDADGTEDFFLFGLGHDVHGTFVFLIPSGTYARVEQENINVIRA